MSLACGGMTAGPDWILRALAGKLSAVATLQGQALDGIRLYLPPSAESRADRYRLAHQRVVPNVGLELAPGGRDVADTFIAMDLSRAWHRDGQATIVVSNDQALAHVVARHAADCGRPHVWLLHRRRRPIQYPLEPGVAGWLDLDVGQPLRPPAWGSWVEAAWRLRRLATYIPDRIFNDLLSGEPRARREDRWERTGMVERDDWHRLEQVDDALAALWRMRSGRPFSEEEARAEVTRRLASDADRTDASVVVRALLAAQLLRHWDRDHLEVPSSWREGLLLPIRRVVLRLAIRDQRLDTPARLRHLHRDRFYSQHSGRDELESHSSADSWEWTEHALRAGLKTIRIVHERRSEDGKSVVSWHLLWTDAAQRIDREARFIHDLVHRSAPCPTEALVATLTDHKIRYPTRWLRCLRDVGLVTHAKGLWRSTRLDF